MQQKYSERKLEDDRNALQKQFQQSKHDLRRFPSITASPYLTFSNFQKELESYRQAWDNQTNELKREHKLRLQGVNLKLGLRVQSLETDTQALHRKLAAAESAAEDFRRRIKLLERDLRRFVYHSWVHSYCRPHLSERNSTLRLPVPHSSSR